MAEQTPDNPSPIGPDGFTRLAGYVAEYVNDSPAALRARVTEAQWNALEMARKADAAERRAEEAEFHVEQLRDSLDRAERRIEAVEALIEKWDHDPERFHVGSVHAAIVAGLRAALDQS